MSEIGKALGQNGHTEISVLAKQYREAEEAYQDWAKQARIRSAQITLAEEAGDTEMVQQIKEQKERDYPSSKFVQTHDARRDTAKALCAALGIDPADFRSALA
tara:strand:+ start:529 stop:837 length:309 start_codon:yes stop_codon:yes gene_type:complete